MERTPGSPANQNLSSAVDDFRRARSRANLKSLLARFTGQSTELLSYVDVRQQLRAYGSSDQGLKDIPLDAIIGSVGRYNDFTRDFLPKVDANMGRWTHIKALAESMVGLPPIDVYQIGDVYFVLDGNHRVSVARQLGTRTIQAYVTEIRTRVPLSPDIQPDGLIVKAEYAEFLDRTRLDEMYPDADLGVTIPGQYQIIQEHIAVHRHYMGNEQKRYISFKEATHHWYDHVYLPVIQAIREGGILRNFPGRTETDLYLWIAEHRASLEEEWGVEIQNEVAALDLLKQEGQDPGSPFASLGGRILNVVIPDIFTGGPSPGQWREEARVIHQDDRLFTDILVPINGGPDGWYALDQAFVFAQREGGRLHGLHVIESEDLHESVAAQDLQAEFARRCQEQGHQGHLLVTVGEISKQISYQARLTDLVVTTLIYPPPPEPLARLDSGFRELIQHCPRPVLAVPQVVTALNHALLSYDGSPKADEALFVGTSLATTWKIPLTVLTIFDNKRVAPETLLRAQIYLEEHDVTAELIAAEGPIARTILETVGKCQADFLIMGGYGFNPVVGAILGSSVDQVLREARKPVLICR